MECELKNAKARLQNLQEDISQYFQDGGEPNTDYISDLFQQEVECRELITFIEAQLNV